MIRYAVLSLSLVVFSLLYPLAAHSSPLDGINSFGYQLQGYSLQQLADSPFDLLVVDYSPDGTQANALKASDVRAVRAGKSGRKVIAYMSIGEAEGYRFYFKDSWLTQATTGRCDKRPSAAAPSWLEKANPDFCDNYKVRFWEASWQRLIFGVRYGANKSYLDRIIDAGFDGVYLDIIDGYYYWLTKKGKQRRASAAADMATFVQRISSYARKTRGRKKFAVIPQNGSDMINILSQGQRTRYLRNIDAIGAESTFYFGESDENNALDPQTYTITALRKFREAGKKVLAIDYLTSSDLISNFKTLACAEGFLPQVGTRALDDLSTEVLTGCNG